jgi:hypothetical protein
MGLGLSALGTLILAIMLVECLSSLRLVEMTGDLRVIQGIIGLGLIAAGFVTMVASTEDTDLQSAEMRHCPRCHAICMASAQFCSGCGQSQPR